MPNVSQFGAQTDNATVQGTVTDRAMVIPDIPPQGLMSVGPRVTPHFVKPSLWSALTTYHFFDAVHDAAGASYVAIKPEVPAGTELTDEEYWFLWADPNSQFADLSELVKTYNGRITQNTNDITAETDRATAKETELNGLINALENDRQEWVLIFGDSWTDTNRDDYYSQWIKNYMSAHQFCKSYGVSGNRTSDLLAQVEKARDDESFDNKSVKKIFTVIGVNDYVTNISTQTSIDNINAFKAAVANTFPNAELCMYDSCVAPTCGWSTYKWTYKDDITFNTFVSWEFYMESAGVNRITKYMNSPLYFAYAEVGHAAPYHMSLEGNQLMSALFNAFVNTSPIAFKTTKYVDNILYLAKKPDNTTEPTKIDRILFDNNSGKVLNWMYFKAPDEAFEKLGSNNVLSTRVLCKIEDLPKCPIQLGLQYADETLVGYASTKPYNCKIVFNTAADKVTINNVEYAYIADLYIAFTQTQTNPYPIENYVTFDDVKLNSFFNI